MRNSQRSTRRPSLVALLTALVLVVIGLSPSVASGTGQGSPKPTVVLLHGDWADASGWNSVIKRLQNDGYRVVAPPNPLRSLATDAASVRAYLDTIGGPIVLVAHSYGGAVISNAATGHPGVKALVYVNAFMPDTGESIGQLAGPDSALSTDPTTIFDFVPATLPPTPATEVYLKRSTVFNAFATGLSFEDKSLVAATQRPATLLSINEPSGTPAWRTIPSWALVGTKDLIIPIDVQRSMANRARSSITTYDAGHLGLMSQPGTVVKVVERAAKAVTR
ncbi:alpha/beta hydrolase [Kribbella sp. NPDC051770]|uniref:alpha/beta fold hydrolase n=1 Tax=Kribbella sp. NPDC051770 TaxID=3155413 RepID=UPI00342518DD